MEKVSAGSLSILTDSPHLLNNLKQIHYAARAHRNMFHTKLPAIER